MTPNAASTLDRSCITRQGQSSDGFASEQNHGRIGRLRFGGQVSAGARECKAVEGPLLRQPARLHQGDGRQGPQWQIHDQLPARRLRPVCWYAVSSRQAVMVGALVS
jgi:hypothetical protein